MSKGVSTCYAPCACHAAWRKDEMSRDLMLRLRVLIHAPLMFYMRYLLPPIGTSFTRSPYRPRHVRLVRSLPPPSVCLYPMPIHSHALLSARPAATPPAAVRLPAVSPCLSVQSSTPLLRYASYAPYMSPRAMPQTLRTSRSTMRLPRCRPAGHAAYAAAAKMCVRQCGRCVKMQQCRSSTHKDMRRVRRHASVPCAGARDLCSAALRRLTALYISRRQFAKVTSCRQPV